MFARRTTGAAASSLGFKFFFVPDKFVWHRMSMLRSRFRAVHKRVYSPVMDELIPPRSRSVTAAAVLVVITGCFWLAHCGPFLWLALHRRSSSGFRQALIVASLIVLICASIGTVIAGFGVLFRRNWARNFAIALAVPWILFGWWFLRPLLRLPASLYSRGFVALYALPILAAIVWLALLAGEKVRTEFLPPAIVQIYVNLLNEGPPRSRLTRALALGNGLFELLPTKDYDLDDKHWEFRPGSIVRGIETRRDGESHLLAVSFGS